MYELRAGRVIGRLRTHSPRTIQNWMSTSQANCFAIKFRNRSFWAGKYKSKDARSTCQTNEPQSQHLSEWTRPAIDTAAQRRQCPWTKKPKQFFLRGIIDKYCSLSTTIISFAYLVACGWVFAIIVHGLLDVSPLCAHSARSFLWKSKQILPLALTNETCINRTVIERFESHKWLLNVETFSLYLLCNWKFRRGEQRIGIIVNRWKRKKSSESVSLA